MLGGGIFGATDAAVFGRGVLLLLPRAKRAVFEDAVADAASTRKLWLRAQLIQMTSMGVLVGVGLWIAGVPSAAALGLLTGLSDFIPYVGPLAALVPALVPGPARFDARWCGTWGGAGAPRQGGAGSGCRSSSPTTRSGRS